MAETEAETRAGTGGEAEVGTVIEAGIGTGSTGTEAGCETKAEARA